MTKLRSQEELDAPTAPGANLANAVMSGPPAIIRLESPWRASSNRRM